MIQKYHLRKQSMTYVLYQSQLPNSLWANSITTIINTELFNNLSNANQGDSNKTTLFLCTSIYWKTHETDCQCRKRMVRKWQSTERNKKCHKKLWDLQKVQEATTKTMYIPLYVFAIPRVDCNGPKAKWWLPNLA